MICSIVAKNIFIKFIAPLHRSNYGYLHSAFHAAITKSLEFSKACSAI